MEINQALKICLQKDIKVYPVHKNYKWYIEASVRGRKKLFEKPLQQKDVNDALVKTYIHYAEKIEK